VEVGGGDDADQPALAFEVLAAADVPLPLPGVLQVVASVVLDGDLQRRVGEIRLGEPAPVSGVDRTTDLGLGQARKYQEKPETRFHRGVDAAPDQSSRLPCQPNSPCADSRVRLLDERLGTRAGTAYQ